MCDSIELREIGGMNPGIKKSNGKKFIIGGIVMSIAVLLFFAGTRTEEPVSQQRELYFPWRIEVRPDGLSRVFGITLGKSTLEDAQRIFRDTGDIKMFVSPENQIALEVFFKSVNLNGIRGKFVLGLSSGEETMKAMLERGMRVKSMIDGTRKVTLHPEDLAQLRYVSVTAITYLPSADLEEGVIAQRFGEPEKRIPEQEQAGIVHWFYPHLGLDIVLNGNGKDIFQYVAPREFDRLRKGF
uniref:Uncharacterized protein n=1 Tax=Candidatus Kentrum sp. TUN TaxID=2126343 RepID=A0A450ZAI6_9GAMM|nr:MAG: hypothetical protein BECKTUN1418E_GA0071001_100154 [Candidatus Kentron sp. TUN]VFK50789.1 MAG: hypothetical protein BECKTUN1418D_GA0071000_10029 [Candidatus Kentron sp. TUN]VFK51289.1 MAG: hypothetical protein BECKTUN1418F_GA0071002_100154 [Candidatus Kentron sp. TUN]